MSAIGSATTSAQPTVSQVSTSCGKCGKTDLKLLACSRCTLQSYCGRECQVADWSQHKKVCVKKIEQNNQFWQQVQLEINPWLQTNVSIDVSKTWDDLSGLIEKIKKDNELENLVCDLVWENYSFEDGKQRTCLDLGCGIGDTSIFFLQRGWKVIALDVSGKSLDVLKKQADEINKKWLETGVLTIVNTGVEEYTFPEKVNLIVANDVFPYVHPGKMQEVWNKVSGALAVNGSLIGSFVMRQREDEQKWVKWGAWFVHSKEIVHSLLESSSYKVDFCENRDIETGSITSLIRFHATKNSK